MAYKPADFFIGVIDLFGVLIPGSAILFLQGPHIRDVLKDELALSAPALWVTFFVGAYIVGHFLCSISELLNVATRLGKTKRNRIQHARAIRLGLDKDLKSRQEAYYRAYSIVSLKSQTAIAEIEHKAAEFKLFRSLIVVFALDLILGYFTGRIDVHRGVADLILVLASAWRFWFLLNWTQALTFEYYSLLAGNENREEANEGVA